MPAIVPFRFLVRMCLPCLYQPNMVRTDDDELLSLPESTRLENFAALDGAKNFAEVRLGWNEFGIGLEVSVSGKKHAPQGNVSQLRAADGLTLWLDTRDSRTSHRASRYCHQFHFLPTGGGDDGDEPAFLATKINRALQDAPLAAKADVPFRCHTVKGGYRLEAFLTTAALTGFDPEQHPRLGICYAIRDEELGEQFLSVNTDFPMSDDPSLWSVLELVKPANSAAG